MKENKSKKRLRQLLSQSPFGLFFRIDLLYRTTECTTERSGYFMNQLGPQIINKLIIYLLDQRCPEDCFKMT